MFQSAENYLAPLDDAARRRHRLRNFLHTVLLLAAGIGLLSLTALTIFGIEGLVWAAMATGISLYFSSRLSPQVILGLYRARALSRKTFPQGWQVMDALSARAGLPETPQLYYVPSSNMNAFAVGRPGNAAIAVTDGLIRGLTLRQFAAVMAHEMSHIRNGDIKVMALADMVTRLTNSMAFVGLFMLMMYLPQLAGNGDAPWLVIASLIVAPTFAGLLQLALSRTREYEADLDAVGLTGDPEGLATALLALEKKHGAIWEGLVPPGGRIPDPSLLRTHPKTEERVRRLRELEKPLYDPALSTSVPLVPPDGEPVTGRPRYRMTGTWY
ncbi:hypothetical protein MNBD_ALPHA09-217 [hydrothermal vent metagenome]|uniref:Peptidase M48 domain-containing protein n=1 Tax=hydrothermal vent metagenome TaxID=652676 RepID=A0A3B0TCP0_9ZZZZ